MAGRVVAMVLLVLTSGAMGVLAECTESPYTPDAPSGDDNTVWLYVFKNSFFSLHSGVGTQRGYWIYSGRGVSEFQSYTQDRCNGQLQSWHKLGTTDKTKEEVQDIVNDLMNTCYPGYTGCWKFINSLFRLMRWNCNYFTHHLAAALDVVDNYPDFL